LVATVTGIGDADAYDEFEPLDSAGEDEEIGPLEIVPYWVPIESHDPEIGGLRSYASSSSVVIAAPHPTWISQRW
jgi:hypothetical protein